jgi:hypothetical protein
VYNFSAGPAILPLEVLQEAQRDCLNYGGSGMSVMEMSHRSKAFEGARVAVCAVLWCCVRVRVCMHGGSSLRLRAANTHQHSCALAHTHTRTRTHTHTHTHTHARTHTHTHDTRHHQSR